MPTVLFDYGNVVCLPQPESDVARMARAAGCGVAAFTEAYWRHRLAYDRADLDASGYWQKVSADCGQALTRVSVAELTRLDTESWTHIDPLSAALIADLAAAGHQLALLSNAPTAIAAAVAELPLARAFACLVFSCELRAAKPSPAAYHAVLARLGGAPAADVIFLDDRQENVTAASALGLRAARVTGGGQARAALAALRLAGL